MLEPNIYSAVVFNLHRQVRDMLDALDLSGQIDRDEHNAPHVVSVDPSAPCTFKCVFIRNGKPESFVLHTRKRAEPVRSWREDDGYKRAERKEPEPENSGESSRKERERRKHTFEHIMEQILPPRKF